MKYTTEDFVRRAQIKHGVRYDYSKSNYLNSTTKLIIGCPIHGDFLQVPAGHLSGYGCVKCSYNAGRRHAFTEADDAYLLANYKTLGITKCCSELKRHVHTVKARAVKLGLDVFKERRKNQPTHDNIPSFLWKTMKDGATRRNLSVEIDRNFLWGLYLKQDGKCALTGWDITLTGESGTTSASVDRIDSSEGYTSSNTQLVHKAVNRCKFDYSEEFFFQVCRAVYLNKRDLFEAVELDEFIPSVNGDKQQRPFMFRRKTKHNREEE